MCRQLARCMPHHRRAQTVVRHVRHGFASQRNDNESELSWSMQGTVGRVVNGLRLHLVVNPIRLYHLRVCVVYFYSYICFWLHMVAGTLVMYIAGHKEWWASTCLYEYAHRCCIRRDESCSCNLQHHSDEFISSEILALRLDARFVSLSAFSRQYVFEYFLNYPDVADP